MEAGPGRSSGFDIEAGGLVRYIEFEVVQHREVVGSDSGVVEDMQSMCKKQPPSLRLRPIYPPESFQQSKQNRQAIIRTYRISFETSMIDGIAENLIE